MIVCPVDTAGMQKQLLASRCGTSGCHGSLNSALGLDLVSDGLVARLAGKPSIGCRGETLLVPGAPDQSELFRKVVHENPECGTRMPPVGFPNFATEEVECIRRWIAGLATSSPDAGVDALVASPDATVSSPDMMTMSCPSGQRTCSGTCVDTATNTLHCGGCGITCGSQQVCRQGACVCAGTLTACAGTCVDVTADGNNCGRCGNGCGQGAVCAAGVCVRGGCPSGTTECGGACVNTQDNALHCGACGVSCTSGKSCVAGACTVTCTGGTTACDGRCVTTNSDAMNCGACGKTCGNGESCNGGVCVGCGPAVSFRAQVQPILTAGCTTNCHSGKRPAGGLGLEASVAYAEMVGVTSTCGGRKHVAPGQPDASYLINKLTGIGMCSGSVMPKADGMLPATQVDLIRAWICQGAPNN
jgi:hypothetical protein